MRNPEPNSIRRAGLETWTRVSMKIGLNGYVCRNVSRSEPVLAPEPSSVSQISRRTWVVNWNAAASCAWAPFLTRSIVHVAKDWWRPTDRAGRMLGYRPAKPWRAAVRESLAELADRGYPWPRLVPVRDGDFAAALAVMPRPDFVLLSRRPLQLGAGPNLHRLAQANPGSLILQLGQHVDEGVRESSLDAVTDDPADLKLWRRLIARARRSMRSGAVITNPMTHASTIDLSHRYTNEAFHLQATGVTMLALAGWNTYRLLPDQDST